MPTLSIIVPIYNGAEYLKKCVDSILAQEYTDFEVILVDDGSKDNSLQLCREYEQKDSRVVVFHKQNAGLVAARKSGVSVAKGKYIGFVDCDDFIDEDMYSRLMSEVEKHGSDIVAGGMTIDYKDHSIERHHIIPEGFYDKKALETVVMPRALAYSDFIKFGIMPATCVKVFKREILEKALPNVSDSIKIGEDVCITFYSLAMAESLSVVRSSAYHYVQSDGSMIRGFNPNRLNDMCALWDCISKIDNADFEKQSYSYISYIAFAAVSECVTKSGYDKAKMKEYLLNVLNHEMVASSLKMIDTSKFSFKDKMRVFLMRHKMVGVLKLLIRG